MYVSRYIIYGITFRILWKNQEYFLLAKKTCYLLHSFLFRSDLLH